MFTKSASVLVRSVDFSLGDPNDMHDRIAEAARQHTDQQHGDAFVVVAQNELVDAETAQEIPQSPAAIFFEDCAS